MSNPHDYTVGWICAIATEYLAAQLFLDEEHDGPDVVTTNDNNDYTLGKIGKHNVVIAVLPHGEYGISSAAGVVKDMLHSFPSVRIGLMVGIGGGAPSSQHDIRLGDVVVSTSTGTTSAVLQYDFGKAVQGQEFKETGFLNQPPPVLRAAVNGLLTQYKRKGHQLGASIEAVLAKNPRLKREFQRPELDTDRLYQSSTVHPPGGQSSCATACGDKPSTLVARDERSEYDDDPAIHHGLIASSNRLMKDAFTRDALVAKKGVLCFEMEAAGLMNHFPFLVVRGICDYSDSHKNKEWQGYAAMTAAAYAKDLLHRIAPTRVEAEKRISEIISELQKEVTATSRKADTIIHHQRTQKHNDILNWLTPVNYGPQQSDYLARRQSGTGQWLLDTAEFRTWRDTRGQTLFCPGIPGAGKTILTSTVADSLEKAFRDDKAVGIAYVYCNFRRQDEQTAVELLASLLRQLAQGLPEFPKKVKSLYDEKEEKCLRPSFDEILSTLQSTVQLYSRVFFLADALDECRAYDGSRATFLASIFNLQSNPQSKSTINVFATSRFIPEITRRFQDSVSLEIRATGEDVRRYIHGQMSRLPASVRNSSELQGEVVSGIVASVEGMFLLAQLHLESLLGKTSPKAVRSALANMKLSTELDAYDVAYKTAMERIERQVQDHRSLAMQTLTWITCAKRPLTTTELQHALAVEVNSTKLDKDALPEIEDMVMVCVGLVTVDEEGGIIRLVHYTTQQYFDKTRSEWFPNAEEYLTNTCVRYLSFDVFGSGHRANTKEYGDRLSLNPFYYYAAKNWGHHARESPVRCHEISGFLASRDKVESSSQVLMRSIRFSRDSPTQMRPLHLAAYFGLEDLVQSLLDGDDLDPRDCNGRTPLSWAASNGHRGVVNLLLESKQVNVNSYDEDGRTPLSWAAEGGQEAIVQLLLKLEKVNANSTDRFGTAPLYIAADHRHEGTFNLLIESDKVDINSKNGIDQSPLSLAVELGREAIVGLLLKSKGVDVNSKNGIGQTPLSNAAIQGYEGIVNLLLQSKDVNVDSRDRYGLTPLSNAARRGNIGIVKLLLERSRVDVNSRDNLGLTPLLWAARTGHGSIIELLGSSGHEVDFDVMDDKGRNVLWYVEAREHGATVSPEWSLPTRTSRRAARVARATRP